jgi:signal transduction histidine kinase
LTGLKFDVFWVREQLGQPACELKQELLVDKLDSTLTRVDSTIHSVRRIATDLRPAVLDTLGLAAAIEWQATDFEKRTGIRCRLSTNVEDLTINRETSTAMFRIFQETLTNIARHASATSVNVDLRNEGGYLLLRTRDNGKGIEDTELRGSPSLGIAGMQERVKLLDGKIQIVGEMQEGTLVEVSIPLNGRSPRRLQDKV